MKRLPVLHVLKVSLEIVRAKRMALFVALLPISLLWLLYGYVIQYIAAAAGEEGLGPMLLNYALFLLYIPIYTAFAVTVHRIVLIGNHAVPWFGQLLFHSRELKFCACVLMCGFLYLVLIAVLANLLGNIIPAFTLSDQWFFFWVLLLARFFAAYPLARIALCFPALAVDDYFGLQKTWRLSDGNSLRLFLVVAVVPMIFQAMMRLLPETSFLPVQFLYAFASFAMFAVGIAILSVSYQWLVQLDERDSGDAAPDIAGTDRH